MDDSSIRNVITRVLPQLPGSILDILEETLQSLGVETTEDFAFIQENDLLSVLRPVQARKLVTACKQTSKYILTKCTGHYSYIVQHILSITFFCFTAQDTEIRSHPALSSLSSSSSSSFSASPSPSCLITGPDWTDCFEIPWTNFPEELTQCFEREKRPNPRLRQEMVHIVVSEMMKVCPSPNKKASVEIAKKMVAKYPKSLQDVIEGDAVGQGYHSLVKQLQTRVENGKRS